MDVECLYGLIALRMLAESDPANRLRYEAMMSDALNFYRVGLEGCFDHFSAAPLGDGNWHRVDTQDAIVYDDSLAYALVGIYDYEGWSATVQKTYEFLNAIGASRGYPAYNPAVCWAGYLNAATKTPNCDYYDGVSAGILAALRRSHDQPAYQYSHQTITAHASEFMFWGVRHSDFSAVEEQQAMATVCWLGEFLLGYEEPLTRFTQVLGSKGETLTLYPTTTVGDQPAYGEGTPIKAIVLPAKTEELLLEPGYLTTDYLMLHIFAPLRQHDKLRRNATDYEIVNLQEFRFKGEVAFRKVTCRRLLQ
jgi:hypothetical protein